MAQEGPEKAPLPPAWSHAWDVSTLWLRSSTENEWMPQEDRYIASHQPHLAVDLIYAIRLYDQEPAWRLIQPPL
jgi:hypothetical protein